MSLKKRLILFYIFLLTGISVLWAGDTAIFVDLGFSPDGRYYMFGQYGVLSPSLRPWAEIYVVNVATNTFVTNGRASFTQTSPIRAGQDGSGILHQLVAGNSALSSRYNINFQNQGLPLYISRDENPSPSGERITFRDFISGNNYTAQLMPTITGSGRNISSRFHINLYINSQTIPHIIGAPNFSRQQVVQYNIKRVFINSVNNDGSGGNSIIFVIEMKCAAENGFDIRYMVEAFRLP